MRGGEQVSRGVLDLQGGHGATPTSGTRRHGASAGEHSDEGRKNFAQNPLATFSQIAERSPASFGDLKEDPTHF